MLIMKTYKVLTSDLLDPHATFKQGEIAKTYEERSKEWRKIYSFSIRNWVYNYINIFHPTTQTKYTAEETTNHIIGCNGI